MHKPQRLLMQGQQNQLNDLPALEEFGGRVRPSMHGIVPRRCNSLVQDLTHAGQLGPQPSKLTAPNRVLNWCAWIFLSYRCDKWSLSTTIKP